MKIPASFAKIRSAFDARSAARRLLATQAADALNASKRAIFAFHRGDAAGAEKLIATAGERLASCEQTTRPFPDLDGEGVYHAALEEYAEACLFAQYLRTGAFGALEKRLSAPDIYLGGLSDATGEILRHATRRATEGEDEAVEQAFHTVEGVVAFLYELDLTGYLRTKFDQAKKNLRSLEQMRYERRLRT